MVHATLLLTTLLSFSSLSAASSGRHAHVRVLAERGLLSSSRTAELQTAMNVVLEQAVGILPNEVVQTIQNDVTSLLNPLLPPSLQALTGSIQSSIASVTAALTGNVVTEAEKLETCLTALATSAQPLTTLKSSTSCLVGDLTAADSNVMIALNGVLQQFVGYLPPNAVDDIVATLSPVLETLPTSELTTTISNALESYTATLSGNAVTAAELLEPCIVGLVATNGVRTAQACMKPTLDTAFVAVNGVVEQLFDVMAPNLVIDLMDLTPSPLAATTAGGLLTTFQEHLVELSQSVPTVLEKDGGLENCLEVALEGSSATVDCDIFSFSS